MRTVLLLMLLSVACWAGAAYGPWKLNAARSTFAGDNQPRSCTIRIEPHPKGEVFTLDRIEADGRATSFSTTLYFDGAEREYRDSGCTGSQSSRRVDAESVEILRKCAGGSWNRLVHRSPGPGKELVIEITEQREDGRRFERRMVLEKH
jgi:hypothetical protein